MKPTITIAAIAGNRIEEHIDAIIATEVCVPYRCKTLLISPEPYYHNGDWIEMPDFGSPRTRFIDGEISKQFMLGLNEHIKTDFVITVQHDGYALNPDMWTDEFLEYDYVGAPWPLWQCFIMPPYGNTKIRVGSGGFSLRSKKWLATAALSTGIYNGHAEDVYACRCMNDFMTDVCKIAPLEVAKRWAIEHRLEFHPKFNADHTFGFHGLDRHGRRPLHSMSIVSSIWNAALKYGPRKLGIKQTL